MRLNLLACLIGSLSIVGVLDAAEIRVVRVRVQPDFSPPPCLTLVGWSSETFFHNSTDTVQTVQFLGVSNGSARPDAKPLLVPPHETVKIWPNDLLNWDPTPGTILWVNRLDVPTGVIVANRVTSNVFDVSFDTSGITCLARVTTHAGLPLPVVATLVPAGTAQYFLGTDVGSDVSADRLTDARLNVGVYNGGSVSATAIVSVYCGFVGSETGFPNSLVLTDRIQIPANTVVQKTVLSTTTATTGCLAGGVESFSYATVTVDQPSFGYAIGLANGTLPKFPGTVALAYTGNQKEAGTSYRLLIADTVTRKR
jgi:hypothetical protein